MKHLKLSLFIIGTLLTIFAFFLGNADSYPFILKIVSPAYVNGMNGIRILESKKDLKPGLIGFKEIALPLANRIIHPQTKEQLSGCVIAIIEWPKTMGQAFGTSGVKTFRIVKAKCTNGNQVETTMAILTKRVATYKIRDLEWYALIIFLLGLTCTFISFFL